METLILLAIGLLALTIIFFHLRKAILLSRNDGKGACDCGTCSSSCCKEWSAATNQEQYPHRHENS